MVPIRSGLATEPLASALVADFASRYRNPATVRSHTGKLADLFTTTNTTHASQLTEAKVLGWAGAPGLSNNTVRNRLSAACTVLRYACRLGHADPAVLDALASRDNPLKHSTPRLYGKVQSANPARWLTREQAYTDLLGTCDLTDPIGLRDAIALRLGLSGMRVAELTHLTLRSLLLNASPPELSWIAKGGRARRIVTGPALIELLRL